MIVLVTLIVIPLKFMLSCMSYCVLMIVWFWWVCLCVLCEVHWAWIMLGYYAISMLVSIIIIPWSVNVLPFLPYYGTFCLRPWLWSSTFFWVSIVNFAANGSISVSQTYCSFLYYFFFVFVLLFSFCLHLICWVIVHI